MLVGIIFFAAFLALDIAYPKLWFMLRHGWAVDGGEISDWYCTRQKISRIFVVGAIVLLVILTFAV